MFSKSKTKRFKEEVTCAPPVGTYNLPDAKSAKLSTFQKSDRFKISKELPTQDLSSNKSDFSLQSFNKAAMCLQHQSTGRKKQPPCAKRFLKENSSDGFEFCRKSLEADVEFQESKVNALLEKLKNLEIEMTETRAHSEDIEENNQKLLDLLENIRKENVALQLRNQELAAALNKMIEEKNTVDASLDDKIKYIDELKRNMDAIKSQHEEEIHNLKGKLSIAQDLNCDFREQLESIENNMTDNLRGLSDKYETLENTLEHVQKDYKNKLERSNSLVEKTKEAHEKSKEELLSMQDVNQNLKGNIENLSEELQTTQKSLEEKLQLLQNYQEREIEQKNEIRKLKAANEEQGISIAEKITVYENKLQLAEETISEAKQKWEQEKDIYKNEMKNLSNEMKDVEEKRIEISKHFEMLSTEVEQHKIVNTQLEEQLTTWQEKLDNQEILFKEKLEQESREKKMMQDNFTKIQNEVAKQLMETQIKLSNAEAKNSKIIDEKDYEKMVHEMEMWRKKCTDLEKKVAPFMADLDRFELERENLMNENKYTQQEMNKLSDKYAQILGHQNHKQKIHHVKKLKEENLSLKAEVMRLRSLQHKTAKSKSNENISSIRKFEKAFSHQDKENLEPRRQPLKTSNS